MTSPKKAEDDHAASRGHVCQAAGSHSKKQTRATGNELRRRQSTLQKLKDTMRGSQVAGRGLPRKSIALPASPVVTSPTRKAAGRRSMKKVKISPIEEVAVVDEVERRNESLEQVQDQSKESGSSKNDQAEERVPVPAAQSPVPGADRRSSRRAKALAARKPPKSPTKGDQDNELAPCSLLKKPSPAAGKISQEEPK